MRQHESSSAAEHLRMMAKRNSALESKVTAVTCRNYRTSPRATRSTCVWFLQLDDVKGELLERFKVLPVLSSRVSELESNNDELREKNRQMEQKLGTMQVKPAPRLPRQPQQPACRHQYEGSRILLYCCCLVLNDAGSRV